MKELIDADQKFAALYQARYSWWVHWRELAEFILPRRYQWLVTPNQGNRGSQLNQNIIDSTGTIAARTCAAGLMAGITSPGRPWFKLRLSGFNAADTSNPVSIWLSEVEARMMKVFAESNFYQSLGVMYFDLTVFGTAAQIIYEDRENIIQCYNPCLGEFYLGNNDKLEVEHFYREFTMNVTQMEQRFGRGNMPESLATLLDQPANSQTEFKVRHCIEPNVGRSPVPKAFPYREYYWVVGHTDKPLLKKGFYEFPANCPRWDTVGNDAYGRGPGMDALPDIKQLQQEQKRKAQALDKMVNPPMVADIQLKNQPASLLPGGITYVAGMNNVGFKPVFQINPPFQELMLDIQQVQERIKTVFFNDLFLMISQLDTVRSATEIDARREEKLVMLGPVLERLESELLSPAITRTFNIMSRTGLLPPPPEEIARMPIDIEYVSMLAEAQRIAATSGMERLVATVGNLAGAKPDVLDNIDFDEFVGEYGSLLRVNPKIVRDKEAVAGMREQRNAQAQAQQGMQMAGGLAEGAKLLSETDVGGGQNALSMMLQ